MSFDAPAVEASGSPSPSRYTIGLLDGFAVSVEHDVLAFPPGEQRLVAYVALRNKPVTNATLAGALWGQQDRSHAPASLRSTVHRVRRRAPGLLVSRERRLAVSPGVTVDVHETDRAVDAVLRTGRGHASEPVLESLTRELLPGWYEDWVLFERERLRQRFLRALEELGRCELRRHNPAAAIAAALASVAMEPLRETPRRLLISAHLSEGNVSEAVREYHRYAGLLEAELGIEPTAEARSLLPPSAVDRRPRVP